MSIQIKSINLVDEAAISYRDIDLNGEHVQSISIYQTDGSFITTEPFKNKIIWYPQSPNNASNSWLGEWKTFNTFEGYGNLYYPLDAKFDFARRRLWIADSGNQRVLCVNIDTEAVVKAIENIYMVHSIAININNGDVFIKSIKNTTTGIIFNYSIDGVLKETFEFSCPYGIDVSDISNTYAFVQSLPLPSSMVFDHGRWRLWWTSIDYVYMADFKNKNIVPYNLNNTFKNARGIDIDFSSGNAFVIAQTPSDLNWHILQMFRDCNRIISTAWVAPMETT